MHYRERSTHRTASSMGEMLCRLSEEMESTDDLVDILGCSYEEISLPMLGEALFERGLLAPRYFSIRSTGTIALGDVGYETEAGNFVVVDNIHHYLQAESGTLSWKKPLQFFSGDRCLWGTPAEVIESKSGRSYQRRRQVHLSVCLRLVNNSF